MPATRAADRRSGGKVRSTSGRKVATSPVPPGVARPSRRQRLFAARSGRTRVLWPARPGTRGSTTSGSNEPMSRTSSSRARSRSSSDRSSTDSCSRISVCRRTTSPNRRTWRGDPVMPTVPTASPSITIGSVIPGFTPRSRGPRPPCARPLAATRVRRPTPRGNCPTGSVTAADDDAVVVGDEHVVADHLGRVPGDLLGQRSGKHLVRSVRRTLRTSPDHGPFVQ